MGCLLGKEHGFAASWRRKKPRCLCHLSDCSSSPETGAEEAREAPGSSRYLESDFTRGLGSSDLRGLQDPRLFGSCYRKG